jgi:hypothetical protein
MFETVAMEEELGMIVGEPAAGFENLPKTVLTMTTSMMNLMSITYAG